MLPFPIALWTDLQAVDSKIERELKIRSGSVLDLVSVQFETMDYYCRPALLLAVARAYGVQGEKAVDLAGVVQFIYLATGVHTIVNDDREGTADFQFPVLVGDYLYGQFFLQLCKANALKYLDQLSRVICEIHEGGILKYQQSPDLPASLEILAKQEGTLPAAACSIGADLGGAPPAERKKFAEFGSALGLAVALSKSGLDSQQVKEGFARAEELLNKLPVPVPELVKLTEHLAYQNSEDRGRRSDH